MLRTACDVIFVYCYVRKVHHYNKKIIIVVISQLMIKYVDLSSKLNTLSI